MVRQYPYLLYAEIKGESYRDENGDWVVPTPKRVFIGNCRDEVNGSGMLITGMDGQKHKYTLIIYAPKSISSLEVGTQISVETLKGEIRAKGEVLRYSKDQLHTRLWV